MPNNETVSFDDKGIGEVLQQNFLQVPLNQREYSWEEEHVTDLFTDFSNAISKQTIHFLGPIVLTGISNDSPEVSDGQQRLATTTILLAAIRDYFASVGDAARVQTIETSYLMDTDLDTTNILPKLRLNVDDNEFFAKRVLANPTNPSRRIEPTQQSHKCIISAMNLAKLYIYDIIKPHKDEYKTARLLELIKFIRNGARVIVLRAPDHMNAFMMFETLNDRGLKASQADLLKNHLLSHTKERIQEAQQNWAKMVGVLDTLGLKDVTVTFLHHFLITKHGPIRASAVFDKIKLTINSQNSAIEFVSELADASRDYAALFNPDDKKWNEYGTSTRKHISTINRDLRVAQIRPLMFAVARHFSVSEARKAFRYFVFWSVRFLIVGGRGGLLDTNYSKQAQEIGTKKITKADELAKALGDIIPTDAMFEAAFAEARVSQEHLARYYLRALELNRTNDPEPELLPSDDEQAINLEHVLPENPQSNWPAIDSDTASAYYKRIGNLVLLQATKNSLVGNMPFAQKQPILAASAFLLTQEVAVNSQWGVAEIESRQRELAKRAVTTWPIKR